MFEYVLQYIQEFWLITCRMAPWLLFGFLAAGILSVFFSPEYVRKHLGKKGLGSIIKAALFGVPLPLCSCGVIPVTASLKKQGAGKGAAGSFLISTPQTGVDSIFATYSMLGLVYAIFRPVVAFFTGIIGGVLIERFGEDNGKKTEKSSKSEKCSSECSCEQNDCFDTCETPACCTSCDLENEENSGSGKVGCPVCTALHYGFFTLLGDIAFSLVIGLALAALISMIVPEDLAANYLQSDWLAMPAMLLFGIPLYVCSTASVPIAAALIAKGISPGAALIFLITGPATNAATVTAMSKVLGKRSIIIYLLTVAVSAVLAGILLNHLQVTLPPAVTKAHHSMAPGVGQNISAVILLALIAYSLFKKFIKTLVFKSHLNHQELLISISGMTCSHCQAAATKAIASVSNVKSVEVDLGTHTAAIHTLDPEVVFPEIRTALEAQGFTCELKSITPCHHEKH
jgi:uncharacterized membrane protein YraQ (UPF0718 family)/copper chaperone CopZ